MTKESLLAHLKTGTFLKEDIASLDITLRPAICELYDYAQLLNVLYKLGFRWLSHRADAIPGAELVNNINLHDLEISYNCTNEDSFLTFDDNITLYKVLKKFADEIEEPAEEPKEEEPAEKVWQIIATEKDGIITVTRTNTGFAATELLQILNACTESVLKQMTGNDRPEIEHIKKLIKK